MSLRENLQEMERCRESYWLRYRNTSPIKLGWRALTVRHSFHVLPGERILELGAGSGLWTRHLTEVLRGENPITAAVFNEDLLPAEHALPNVQFTLVQDLSELPSETFDYVVGTVILCHDLYPQNLHELLRVLKPNGQLLFFEANYWNPQVWLKCLIPPLGRWLGNADCEVGMRKYRLLQIASHQGFTEIDIIPYDIIHPLAPTSLIPFLQALAFILEHAPLIREFSGTLYIWARKPGAGHQERSAANLAEHRALFGSTSFVIPCRNEEMNIVPLTEGILRYYGPYVHEIIIVNDGSTDRTAEVTQALAAKEPRLRLINRKPPNGVGRALRDGYAAATGTYILSMDCDFVQILPEFRDLFDVVAAGHEGAIGSRFSHESLLINYPFVKILCNRGFHLLANLLLRRRVRDVSNNLKLYRTEILKDLDIQQPGFAANAETGLKPLLAGRDIREVPISWINRTITMGSSSFHIPKVASGYFAVLLRIVRDTWFSKGPNKEIKRL
jgi:SAM-dependent methyltransferase